MFAIVFPGLLNILGFFLSRVYLLFVFFVFVFWWTDHSGPFVMGLLFFCDFCVSDMLAFLCGLTSVR